MAAIRGLQTPQATTTTAVSMSPPVVRTAETRPSIVSIPVTSVRAMIVSAPIAWASSRISVPARSESTTPALGVYQPPVITDGSRYGMISWVSLGLSSRDSIPHDVARPCRRASSAIRSGVRATSMPPHRVNTPSSVNWRIESTVQVDSSLVPSTGKQKFDAWPVDPPGLGRGPLSTSTMSRQPSLARCQAMALPTMPAPMMTARA